MMELLAFKSLWEWDGRWQDRLQQVAEAGYDGVEYGPPAEPGDDAVFVRALENAGLRYAATVMTQGEDHARSFREQLGRVAQMNPAVIVAHSATDRMSLDGQLAFFEAALRVEEEAGVVVAHETHRARAFYTPWNTARILRELPNLKLGADFSHWSVVLGSDLDIADDDIDLAISRAVHIHGRVGYAHGPQVPDPRAPEHRGDLETYFAMWLEIARRRRRAGADTLTFTPIFGPWPYMQARPFTREPAADLWDVNLWMLDRFRTDFAGLVQQTATYDA